MVFICCACAVVVLMDRFDRKAGVTLRELLQKRRDLVEAESYSEAEQVQKQVAQLERHRLDLAALWMIGFWEKKMTLQR
eukprot:1667980-Amphidinium_carterae.2